MSVHAVQDLAHARATFDQWRTRSSGRGRIPSHLWSLALSLVERHGVHQVARELGLDPTRLRARLKDLAATVPKLAVSTPKFVEVPHAALSASVRTGPLDLGVTTHESRVRLRIDRSDGVSLTLDLAPDGFDLLERLVASFARATS
jgi:hypothetical protein